MKKRSILLVIIFFISIIILSVNSNNKYLVKEESLATYIDGEKTDSFPAKGTVAFSKAECDNNTNIYWDNDTWGLYATNLNEKTKCNLYFKTLENAVTKITNLASTDTVNMASDDPDNNIRYIGANPNNYVYFNCDDYNNQTSDTCELWRIIGVFNNIEKEDGTKENLIKIVRNESVGNLNYDILKSHTNNWSMCGLKDLLNTGGYYISSYGTYSNNYKYDFRNNGLKNDKTKNSMETVKWHIGSVNDYANLTTLMSYGEERSNNMYESASAIWLGKIGLIYPSDYGYATSGGSNTDRNSCITASLYTWNNSSLLDCKKNNYIFKEGIMQWTITSIATNKYQEVDICDDGKIFCGGSFRDTYPSLYLKSNISIGIGDGSSTNPYQLNL